MEECEVEFSHNDVKAIPLWRRMNPHQVEGLYNSLNPRPRPQSYQSPNGLLVTDFPVEDKHTFTLTQPAERVTTSPDNRISHKGGTSLYRPNGRILPSSSSMSLEYNSVASNQRHLPQVVKVVSSNSISFTANGVLSSPSQRTMLYNRTSNTITLTPDKEQIVFGSSSPNGMVNCNNNNNPMKAYDDRRETNTLCSDPLQGSPKTDANAKQVLQRTPSNSSTLAETQSVVLSTNSPATFKSGVQQIIPKGLASEIKLTNKNNCQNSQNMGASKRILKTRSLVEASSLPLVVAQEDGDKDSDRDSPGTLRRGLRSTSYRRAVVSDLDFSNTTERKKNNRMSQPILRTVSEDKEKFSSLGRKAENPERPRDIW